MKKILFVGGGTLGPVTPLLATAKAIRHREPLWSFRWIGTPAGPERMLVEEAGISFYPLMIAKWPRYPSFHWLRFPFCLWKAKNEARRLIDELRPDAVVTVGGFTAVPVVLEAVKKNILCFTHQLDVIPGLANKQIAPHCVSVTTSFRYPSPPFGSNIRTEQIPTPCAFSGITLPDRASACKHFGLDPAKSVVLLYGGGTGARSLNEMAARQKDAWLSFTQLIHITGAGKQGVFMDDLTRGYALRTFLSGEMKFAYAAADMVICRAGMGSLSELAALSKPATLVPLPNSHQEANAKAFKDAGAALVISQKQLGFDQILLAHSKELLEDVPKQKELGERAHQFFVTDDGSAFAKRIRERITGSGVI